ncbi:MAG: hypothetical protein QT08_C0013G0038 [archaeon GW2011_AR17]|nr:MAG: hypothetical protein QT08_C0013G0038 [archaeon GW2011_AR17]MBS3153880.1 hypothetical protein [Candidatus Woesearchaeota archaeon]HIH15481.1 hypothetical protein [Nanoarchaeota archaeon]HIH59284.1 hypothetical protein [Nanoarchaeota archaeon]HII13921.1 hypothetical protein [Nanoarchaeota archaeon]
MKAIIFDSSTIINLALNNLLWILQPLKEKYKGEFYITESIKKEIIDRPFQIKRFKLEAIQISKEIEKGVLKVYQEQDLGREIEELNMIANRIFIGKKNNYLKIIDEGELTALVLAKKIHAEALVIDERTTRLLIEAPNDLNNIFKSKFKENIKMDQKNLKLFKENIGALPIIRSVEIGVAAYELGILDSYLLKWDKQARKDLLDALLWSMRFKGCAVSEKEMQEILQEELKENLFLLRDKKKQ